MTPLWHQADDGWADGGWTELLRERVQFEIALGRLGIGVVHELRAALPGDGPQAHGVLVVVRIARLRFFERSTHCLGHALAVVARGTARRRTARC